MPVEAVIIAGMIICGASFSLHWMAVTGNLGVYRRVTEFRAYILTIVGTFALLVTLNGDLGLGLARTVREAAFAAATIVSSTGFSTADFTRWGAAAQVILLLVMSMYLAKK